MSCVAEFQEIPGDIEGKSSMLRFWTTQKPGTRSFAQRYEVVAWLTGMSCSRGGNVG